MSTLGDFIGESKISKKYFEQILFWTLYHIDSGCEILSKVSCTLVIRCCNEETHIGRLLNGIMQQTVEDTEIIVVDSGSTDKTVSIAERYPVKICSIRPEDFSFGRSLNFGCCEAKGQFIVAASAHVFPVYTNWLERLLMPFKDPKVALVYGRQCGGESTKYSEHQVFAKWFPLESDWDQSHPFCNNANAAIRRSMWKELPYNETLTGLEDIDWALRAMQLGHKIVYAADAEVLHIHNEMPRHIYNRYRREAIALKKIFPREAFSFWDFVRLFTANVSSDCYHALCDGELRKHVSGIMSFRLMQLWGTYRGFSQHGPVDSELKQRFYYPKGLCRTRSLDSSKGTPHQAEYCATVVED